MMAEVGAVISILASGSRGNCTVIASGTTRLLVDAGLSRRECFRRMLLAGQRPETLDAILISHEHSDHVAGLAKIADALPAPVYANERTYDALETAGFNLQRTERFVVGEAFLVGDIEVRSFTVPHDAADPVAFAFRVEGVRIVLVTDLGYLTENVKDQLRGCDCAIVESNHDLEMLKDGPYPWQVKQRVMSRVGHLSNDGVANYLRGEFDGSFAHLVLAHLSENNNLPALARLSAERALAVRSSRPELHIASQDEVLPAIRL